jgi:hypothetical protein
MLRSLICFGAGLAIASGALAQDRQIRRDIRHGRVVRVVPDQSMVVISTGAGAEVKTFELTVSDATKFWGIDKQPFTDGLRYKGFKEGAEVWYTVGPDVNSRAIAELRFFDPAVAQPTDEKVVYLEGKIVRVDPETGMVVVRTSTGNAAKEVEFKIDKTTKFWADAEKPITTGLRYEGFQPGTAIWYQVSPAGTARVMTDVRFYNPRLIRRR